MDGNFPKMCSNVPLVVRLRAYEPNRPLARTPSRIGIPFSFRQIILRKCRRMLCPVMWPHAEMGHELRRCEQPPLEMHACMPTCHAIPVRPPPPLDVSASPPSPQAAALADAIGQSTQAQKCRSRGGLPRSVTLNPNLPVRPLHPQCNEDAGCCPAWRRDHQLGAKRATPPRRKLQESQPKHTKRNTHTHSSSSWKLALHDGFHIRSFH